MAKYSAWATVHIGTIDSEEMAEMPEQFADPQNPTKKELLAYFELRQQSLAESNTGSEKLAIGTLEIEPED